MSLNELLPRTEYLVLPHLDATHRGPVRQSGDNEEEADQDLIHLRQGDLDGACGPYCVLMALLILGLADRDTVTVFGLADQRSSIGKLVTRMTEGWGTLFHEGTSLDDLAEMLNGLFRRKLTATTCATSGVECRRFVERSILDGAPVILGISSADVAHWVVVVGLEYWVDEDGGRELSRLLLLDPGDPAPTVSAWNGVLEARGSGGRYPYTWWTAGDGGETKVAFFAAMALLVP